MSKTSFFKKLLLVATLLCTAAGVRAQADIVNLGGDARSSYGSLSYSVGQLACEHAFAPAITVVNVTESVNEGLQQPYTPRDNQGEGIQAISASVALYPNPTVDAVILECDNADATLTYTLYNAQGQQLQQGTYHGGQQRIELNEYAAGNYMLSIQNKVKNEQNIYKIIKAK